MNPDSSPSLSADQRERLLGILRERNIRVTRPRQRVAEAIVSVEQPFTAEGICERLPEIGRATVYRTLKLMQEANALCKVVMPNGEMAYSIGWALSESDESALIDHSDSHHHHAVCTVCGSVRSFTADAIERAVQALDSSAQGVLGDVIDHRIEIYDVCPECESMSASSDQH